MISDIRTVNYERKSQFVKESLLNNRPSLIEFKPGVDRNFPISRTYQISKRIFDILVSSLVILLILWWLVPLIAILLMIDSKGPVFFIQKRVGLWGLPFYCLKFRSMIVNEDADNKQAAVDDPRITPLGKFLRRSCIDELPQFFNVFVGDMSIVGPRPHMIADCEAFAEQIKIYNQRHLVRPGITGIAQIKGYRGKTVNFYDVFHRFQWDRFYIRNAGFMFDLWIINKTFIQLLKSFGLIFFGSKNISQYSFSFVNNTAMAGKKPFSVVIAAKDAEQKIATLLTSIKGLSDDVIVCDTGSSDDTMLVAETLGARVVQIQWEGYGKSKNIAIDFAKHDWILSLDSDEKIDTELFQILQNWIPENDHTVYQVLWKNFFGNKWIRHGHWSSNWKNRLFNKNVVCWDSAIAHEDITSKEELSYVRLNGYLEHYSFQNDTEYEAKMKNSARLTALKYFKNHKKSTLLHLCFSPVICFIKVFILKQGFKDGMTGLKIATTTAAYTYRKYWILWKLNHDPKYTFEQVQNTPVLKKSG